MTPLNFYLSWLGWTYVPPVCWKCDCRKCQPRPHFYQTRSAWSVDQGSNKNHSPAYNFAPTVTKFCVMWEGLSLPHDTKYGNCWCKIVDSRAFPSWSLIHGLRWSGLIKAEPGHRCFSFAIKCSDIDINTVWQGNSYVFDTITRNFVCVLAPFMAVEQYKHIYDCWKKSKLKSFVRPWFHGWHQSSGSL